MDWNDPEERAAENMRLLQDEAKEAEEVATGRYDDTPDIEPSLEEEYELDSLSYKFLEALVPVVKEISIGTVHVRLVAKTVTTELMGILVKHLIQLEEED